MPRPIRNFGSASGRRCTRTSITFTPGRAAQLAQLGDARRLSVSAARGAPAVRDGRLHVDATSRARSARVRRGDAERPAELLLERLDQRDQVQQLR